MVNEPSIAKTTPIPAKAPSGTGLPHLDLTTAQIENDFIPRIKKLKTSDLNRTTETPLAIREKATAAYQNKIERIEVKFPGQPSIEPTMIAKRPLEQPAPSAAIIKYLFDPIKGGE